MALCRLETIRLAKKVEECHSEIDNLHQAIQTFHDAIRDMQQIELPEDTKNTLIRVCVFLKETQKRRAVNRERLEEIFEEDHSRYQVISYISQKVSFASTAVI